MEEYSWEDTPVVISFIVTGTSPKRSRFAKKKRTIQKLRLPIFVLNDTCLCFHFHYNCLCLRVYGLRFGFRGGVFSATRSNNQAQRGRCSQSEEERNRGNKGVQTFEALSTAHKRFCVSLNAKTPRSCSSG